jgi:hypothetical protein
MIAAMLTLVVVLMFAAEIGWLLVDPMAPLHRPPRLAIEGGIRGPRDAADGLAPR